MKIVFIGTVKFSKKMLEKLIDIKAHIVGVCTKKESKFNSDFEDLTPLCIENRLLYKYTDDINSKETVEWIKTLNPDIVFCFGWSSLIKKELLNLAPMGIVGYHPTKLPQNRGRHPLIWSLVLGLKQSASTFFFISDGADDGDILSQKDFEILNTDDAQTLYQKVTDIALLQIDEFIPLLKTKTYQKVVQDHKLSNIWRKRGQSDGKIDFRMSSEAIFNLVRALTRPYIGAHIEYNNKNISIWKVKIVEYNQNHIESGKVLQLKDDTIVVKTYDGAIEILDHEFDVLPKVGEYL
ncbi:formyltransferase family protein [Sulfurospirillum sp. UCH001]|uniref:formyltransferase family protein n=1 Tax=Sulfurospirillum sp. UCH001 TaxID=1581011 RepID=UPI00083772AE|nr:formyltransferase family protein [Sulfurospirillum sp. UCH001]